VPLSDQELAQIKRTVANLQGAYGAFAGGQTLQSGKGVPTAAGPIGMLYVRRDAPDVNHLFYVNTAQGVNWTPLTAASGAPVQSVVGDEVVVHVVTAAGVVTVSGKHGDYLDLATTVGQIVSVAKTFSATITSTAGASTDNFSGNGPIKATRGAGTTATYVTPIYATVSGGASANTAHMVATTQSIANATTATITLTNDAILAGALFASVTVDGSAVAPTVSFASGSSFSIRNNDTIGRTVRWMVGGA
jgi:hypothetical protein